MTLTLESTVQITGEINQLPEGKTAPDNHELSADWFTVVGKAPGGDEAFLNKVNEVRNKSDCRRREECLADRMISFSHR